MWLAAWKLVSNDAKRTVAPPNAKHSTLLQGCFLCFFYFMDDSATKHNLSPQIFHRSKKAQPIILIIQIQLFGQKKGGCLKKQPPNFIFGQKFSVSDVVGI